MLQALLAGEGAVPGQVTGVLTSFLHAVTAPHPLASMAFHIGQDVIQAALALPRLAGGVQGAPPHTPTWLPHGISLLSAALTALDSPEALPDPRHAEALPTTAETLRLHLVSALLGGGGSSPAAPHPAVLHAVLELLASLGTSVPPSMPLLALSSAAKGVCRREFPATDVPGVVHAVLTLARACAPPAQIGRGGPSSDMAALLGGGGTRQSSRKQSSLPAPAVRAVTKHLTRHALQVCWWVLTSLVNRPDTHPASTLPHAATALVAMAVACQHQPALAGAADTLRSAKAGAPHSPPPPTPGKPYPGHKLLSAPRLLDTMAIASGLMGGRESVQATCRHISAALLRSAESATGVSAALLRMCKWSEAAWHTFAPPLTQVALSLLSHRPAPSSLASARGSQPGVGDIVLPAHMEWWARQPAKRLTVGASLGAKGTPPCPPATALPTWALPWLAAAQGSGDALVPWDGLAWDGAAAGWGVAGSGDTSPEEWCQALASRARTALQGHRRSWMGTGGVQGEGGADEVGQPGPGAVGLGVTDVPSGHFPVLGLSQAQQAAPQAFLHVSATAQAQAPWLRCAALGSTMLHRLVLGAPATAESALSGILTSVSAGKPGCPEQVVTLASILRQAPLAILGGSSADVLPAQQGVALSLSQALPPSHTVAQSQGALATPAAASRIAEQLMHMAELALQQTPDVCAALTGALAPMLELGLHSATLATGTAAAGGASFPAGRSGTAELARSVLDRFDLLTRKAGVHRSALLRVNAVQCTHLRLRCLLGCAMQQAAHAAGALQTSQDGIDFASSQAVSLSRPPWLAAAALESAGVLQRSAAQQLHVRVAVHDGVVALALDIASAARRISSEGAAGLSRGSIPLLACIVTHLDAVVAARLLPCAPALRKGSRGPRTRTVVHGMEGTVDTTPRPLDVGGAVSATGTVMEPLPSLLRAAFAVACAVESLIDACAHGGMCSLDCVARESSIADALQEPGAGAGSPGKRQRSLADELGTARQHSPALRGLGLTSIVCSQQALLGLARSVAAASLEGVGAPTPHSCPPTHVPPSTRPATLAPMRARSELMFATSAALLDGVFMLLARVAGGVKKLARAPALLPVVGGLLGHHSAAAAAAAECKASFTKKSKASKAQRGTGSGVGSDADSVGTRPTAAADEVASIASARTGATTSSAGAPEGGCSLPLSCQVLHPATVLGLLQSDVLASSTTRQASLASAGDGLMPLRLAMAALQVHVDARSRNTDSTLQACTAVGPLSAPELDCADTLLRRTCQTALRHESILLEAAFWQPAHLDARHAALTSLVCAAGVPGLHAAWASAVAGDAASQSPPPASSPLEPSQPAVLLTASAWTACHIMPVLELGQESAWSILSLALEVEQARAVSACEAALVSTALLACAHCSIASVTQHPEGQTPSKRPRLLPDSLEDSLSAPPSHASGAAPSDWPEQSITATLLRSAQRLLSKAQSGLLDKQATTVSMAVAGLAGLQACAVCPAVAQARADLLAELAEAGEHAASGSSTPSQSTQGVRAAAPHLLSHLTTQTLLRMLASWAHTQQEVSACKAPQASQAAEQALGAMWEAPLGYAIRVARRSCHKWVVDADAPESLSFLETATPKVPVALSTPELLSAILEAIKSCCGHLHTRVLQGLQEVQRGASVRGLHSLVQHAGRMELAGQGERLCPWSASFEEGTQSAAQDDLSLELTVLVVYCAAITRVQMPWQQFQLLLGAIGEAYAAAHDLVVSVQYLMVASQEFYIPEAILALLRTLYRVLQPIVFQVLPADQVNQSRTAAKSLHRSSAQESGKADATAARIQKRMKARADSERRIVPRLIAHMAKLDSVAVDLATAVYIAQHDGRAPPKDDAQGARVVAFAFGDWFKRAVNRDFRLKLDEIRTAVSAAHPQASASTGATGSVIPPSGAFD